MAWLALPACGGEPSGDDLATGESRGRVVVVSIDGLMPEIYLDPDGLGLRVPTLRSLVARGAYAHAVEPVFPTVTYPAHTTIVTGVPPRVHGIISNHPVDPLQEDPYWSAEDIAVPTLWSALEAQGRAAALVTWPVTVGAQATFLVPELSRAGTPDDQKLLRALSTLGLLARVARGYPDLWKQLLSPDVRDVAQFEIAKHLLTKERPELVLLHVWETDDAQHAHGPRSEQAKQAFEHVDRLLGELVAVLERSPARSRTTLVVLSDHGFASYERVVRLKVLFRERGLVAADAGGQITSARVTALEQGGSAYVYLLDPAARAELMAALETVRPAIAKIYTPEEIVAAGGDPTAALALAAAPGWAFSDKADGPVVEDLLGRGTHGYPPSDPSMAASFIAVGPGIPARELGVIRMVDIGPTIARWLGVTLPAATGTPIDGL